MSFHIIFKVCNMYKGTKPLKIYPTWNRSKHQEKQRMNLKYIKRGSPPISYISFSARRPPSLNLNEEAIFMNNTNVVIIAETSPIFNPRVEHVRQHHS